MKKTLLTVLLALLCLLMMTGLAACRVGGGSCEHIDSEVDYICDECGEELEGKPCEHVDTDENLLCDTCGAETDCTKLHNTVNGKCTVCGMLESTKGLSYRLNEDKKSYTVVGIGYCDSQNLVIGIHKNLNVSAIEAGAFRDDNDITGVKMENCVLKIDSNAFYGCTKLANVEMSACISVIGESAFENCSAIRSIKLPDGLEKLGINAFSGCTSLEYNEHGEAYYIGSETNPYLVLMSSKTKEISQCTVHGNAKFINAEAFISCVNLQSVTIGNSVIAVDAAAFKNCTSLESITLPSSVKEIRYELFMGCTSLNDVKLSGDVESIESSAFQGCANLKSIMLPDSLKRIGASAFNGCTSLEGVTFPDGLETIGMSAFANCTKICTVTIPSSVTSLDNAFRKCTSLTSLTIEGQMIIILDGAFDDCPIKYAKVPSMALEHISTNSLEELVLNSNSYVTCGNFKKLKSLVITSNVKVIGKDMFSGCESLESVRFENPDGWWCTSDLSVSGTEISSTDLSDPSTAATYLKETYALKYWRCGPIE